jgi:hypothetical protein
MRKPRTQFPSRNEISFMLCRSRKEDCHHQSRNTVPLCGDVCYPNKMHKKLLAYLLCLFVAFQGSVSAHVFQKPCPMSDMSSVSMSSDSTTQSKSDCCNDDETFKKTGQLCKSDKRCVFSSTLITPPQSTHMPIAFASDPVPMQTTLFTSFEPSGVWRPPSFS